MAGTVREGGCLCGAVRFRAEGEPESVVWCHCTLCRRASGAPATAWATYPVERVTWSGQPLVRHRSSDIAWRGFCARCGGALTFQFTQKKQHLIDLAVGNFDDPAALKPSRHVYASTRLDWMDAGAALPARPEV